MSKDKWDVILGLYQAAGKAFVVLLLLLIIAAAIHSFLSSRGISAAENPSKARALFVSSGHVLIAIGVYWHLITGGWLAQSPAWNDPNIINLALALLEAIAVGSVLAFWIWPRPFLYRFMADLLVIQAVVGLLILIWFLIVLGSLGRNKRMF